MTPFLTQGTDIQGRRGVVASDPPEAAEIGARVLAAGGNAMDAAVAASMACCMLRPGSTGIGGYGCAGLVLESKAGRVWSVDANAVAPAAAHERMYEILPIQETSDGINEYEYACSVRAQANVFGPLAVAVPGMMAAMGTVWERWGRRPWSDIVGPSLALLEAGFAYGPVAGAIGRLEATIRRFPATVAHLMPGGRVPAADERWHRPDMDRTLRRLLAAGWRDFYEGEIGRQIADYLQSAGGAVTREDMRRYQPRVTDPYAVRCAGAEVLCPILPNGPLSTLQALLMMDALDLPADDSPEYWHGYAEVLKAVWRDRLRYLTDPDFAPVPVERLLDSAYAAGRAEPIRQFPAHVDRLDPDVNPAPAHGTLHVSAADADGNLAALTITQGNAFGSCVTVPGTGIILGHGMCRLDPRPGRVNSVAPGKRPLNNMSPLVIRMPGRDVAIGLPGGRRIISVMPRAADGLIRRGWSLRQAAAAPRMHVEGKEPVLIERAAGEAAIEALRAMGHEVRPSDALAGCMNGAEVLREPRLTRAGSNLSAAGVD